MTMTSQNPGGRIGRLPKIFWSPAVFLRKLIDPLRLRGTFVYREVEARLSLGVDYVYGCRVEGDIAEFGTASGITARIIAKAMKRVDHGHFRHFHLFDSFKGLPRSESESDKSAPMVLAGEWQEGEFSALSEAELVAAVGRFIPKENIKIYSGWFSETLRNIPAGTKFSMVHIDSDLYESARDVLNYIFGKEIVQEGAMIFFDDYNGNGASPDRGERRAWREAVQAYGVEYDDADDYGIGSKRFIIHSYKGSGQHHNP
jgi:O-methyltransferase